MPLPDNRDGRRWGLRRRAGASEMEVWTESSTMSDFLGK